MSILLTSSNVLDLAHMMKNVLVPPQIYLGDVHCYLYDVDNWDATLYKRPRFMSEFGLQSWPSAVTMAQVSRRAGNHKGGPDTPFLFCTHTLKT